jgi:hypothetical protein
MYEWDTPTHFAVMPSDLRLTASKTFCGNLIAEGVVFPSTRFLVLVFFVCSLLVVPHQDRCILNAQKGFSRHVHLAMCDSLQAHMGKGHHTYIPGKDRTAKARQTNTNRRTRRQDPTRRAQTGRTKSTHAFIPTHAVCSDPSEAGTYLVRPLSFTSMLHHPTETDDDGKAL